MEQIFQAISIFVLNTIESWGYLGIFVLMLIDNLNFPIPSELILPFAGFLAVSGTFSFWWVVLFGALGSLVGSWISYYVASHYEKWARETVTHNPKYKTVRAWFHKYHASTVFWSRMIPLVRTFISLPAGMFRVNFAKFTLYTFMGSFVWSLFLTYLGFTTGENWQTIGPFLERFDKLIVGIIVIGGGVALFYYFKNKNGKNTNSKLEA